MGQELQKWSVAGLQVLVFQLHGVRFAVDLEQVDELLEPEHFAETGEEPVPLHELIPFASAPVVYRDPRILTVEYRGTLVGLKVDQPETIADLDLEAIRPFPMLVSQCRTADSLWGVGLIQDDPVLLLDCYKLAARMRPGRSLSPT